MKGGCYVVTHQDKYGFYKKIDEYMDFEASLEKEEINDRYDIDNSFIKDIYQHIGSESERVGNIPKLNRISKNFIYLVDLLLSTDITAVPNGNYELDFLNYWLNKEINKIDSDNFCKKSFYQNLRQKNRKYTNLNKLSSRIHDIAEEDLEDMNILYTMYKNYKEINEKIRAGNPKEKDCIELAQKCVEQYKKIKDKCELRGVYFCEVLENFKEKYDKIELCKYNFVNWTKNKLPPLVGNNDTTIPDCKTHVRGETQQLTQDYNEKPQNTGDNSNIDVQNITIGTTATIGVSFIFFILYKFTSIGQFLRSQMNKNERVWENFDEEINHFSHANEYEHFNSENKMYGIAYNS
ncbi:Plasmodium variant antigen protein Cir/Yir/Bir, putative [Plasmodium ovale]|uniref:Plasmodium variant antigen protein Cir/Yir/Bir, putative n=1 Tax=Plasmodium ovale TaxID=36330 RepID=A0A1C3KGC5_PLAOA|nr:Plasmodium variant antigen protein Cir/Yir/Bir, putative [Plasmodium ovale]